MEKRIFEDAKEGMKPLDYYKWMKKSRETYLGVIPAISLLYGDNHRQFYYPGVKYTEEELSTPLIGDLNATQIAKIMDSLDLYTIMNIVCLEGTVFEFQQKVSYGNGDIVFTDANVWHYTDYLTTLGGTYMDKDDPINVYAFPFKGNSSVPFKRTSSVGSRFDFNPYHTKQIYQMISNDHGYAKYSTVADTMTAYELLFRKLRVPVAKVLGAVDRENTHFSTELPYDSELRYLIRFINQDKPEKYKGRVFK